MVWLQIELKERRERERFRSHLLMETFWTISRYAHIFHINYYPIPLCFQLCLSFSFIPFPFSISFYFSPSLSLSLYLSLWLQLSLFEASLNLCRSKGTSFFIMKEIVTCKRNLFFFNSLEF